MTAADLNLRIVQPLQGGEQDYSQRLTASMLATMLYPGDEDVRIRLATAYTLMLRYRTRYGGDLAKDPEAWGEEPAASRAELGQALYFMENSSFTELKERWAQGVVVGQLLQVIFWMVLTEPKSASMKKARYLAAHLFRYSKADGHASRRLSESTIASLWSKYQSVSHFWAAHVNHVEGFRAAALDAGHGPSEGLSMAWIHIMRDPGPFILLATGYLRPITSHTPERTRERKPLLDWQDAWLPPTQSIPEDNRDIFDPSKLYAGLSDSALEILRGYKHE